MPCELFQGRAPPMHEMDRVGRDAFACQLPIGVYYEPVGKLNRLPLLGVVRVLRNDTERSCLSINSEFNQERFREYAQIPGEVL